MAVLRAALTLLFAAGASARAAGGVLVGLSADSPTYLVHVDPLTAAFVLAGPKLPDELTAQQLAAVDPSRGLFFALGFDTAKQETNLVTLNATSGAVVGRVAVPGIFEGDLVGVGQNLDVDPASGHVIVSGHRSSSSAIEVGTIDPATGAVTPIVSLPKTLSDADSCVSAFNPDDGSVTIGVSSAGASELVNVELATKKVTPVAESFAEGHLVQTLMYSRAAKRYVGLGISPDSTHRTVVALDARTFNFTVAGQVDGFLVEMGPISALDPATGTIYWMGAKGATTFPFFVVGVSSTTAKVVSASKALPEGEEPWQLLWLPTA